MRKLQIKWKPILIGIALCLISIAIFVLLFHFDLNTNLVYVLQWVYFLTIITFTTLVYSNTNAKTVPKIIVSVIISSIIILVFSFLESLSSVILELTNKLEFDKIFRLFTKHMLYSLSLFCISLGYLALKRPK